MAARCRDRRGRGRDTPARRRRPAPVGARGRRPSRARARITSTLGPKGSPAVLQCGRRPVGRGRFKKVELLAALDPGDFVGRRGQHRPRFGRSAESSRRRPCRTRGSWRAVRVHPTPLRPTGIPPLRARPARLRRWSGHRSSRHRLPRLTMTSPRPRRARDRRLDVLDRPVGHLRHDRAEPRLEVLVGPRRSSRAPTWARCRPRGCSARCRWRCGGWRRSRSGRSWRWPELRRRPGVAIAGRVSSRGWRGDRLPRVYGA